MPRNMSFFYTQEQILSRTKTVTRRLGWDALKVGDIVMAVKKSQGLRPGETIERFCELRITGKRREPLNKIDRRDCRLEGFPELSPGEFVEMFCEHMNVKPTVTVNRIEFEYV